VAVPGPGRGEAQPQLAAAFITGSDPLGKVAALTVLTYFMAWIVAGVQLVANWRDRRSRGQLPPRPAQSGQALGRGQDGKPGYDWVAYQAREDAGGRHIPGPGVIQRIRWSPRGRRYQRRLANLQVTA
jgi:hypothetical protein